MHQLWLGEISEWTGEYRGVNFAKGAFMFAAAIQIPRLIQDLERGPLRIYTPCSFNTTAAQAACTPLTIRTPPPMYLASIDIYCHKAYHALYRKPPSVPDE